MDDQQLIRVSRFLSKHLRHQPERLGLTLEPGGWVFVEDLLIGCEESGFAISRDELAEVVRRNDKQRFSFDDSGERIRANQGHSAAVDLRLEPTEPPPTLFHGTPEKFVENILREGLRKMSRHHVHLSRDMETAKKVGRRRGKPVVFEINAAAMHSAGFVFFCSTNGVWLVDNVPPEYLRVIFS